MKKIILIICIISISLKSKEIIIKTKSDFTLDAITNYLENNYKSILSDFDTQFFINNRTIFNPKSHYNNLLERSANINSLKNIYIVSYSSSINAEILISKLKPDPSFEFVEQMPKRELLFEANDSLLQQQYYLENIKLFEGLDNFSPSENEVLIAIVDTGLDYLHEDLKENIWINTGETGIDENGEEKESNNIDDDNNGYIDDYRGWDFVSSFGEDNDPYPGNGHGTHVAGIAAAKTNNKIGVVGIAQNSKLVGVKIGSDNPNSRSVARGYEGILYAAIIGADVINCSWGGGGFSQSEELVIETAYELGSIIVAAAGNDNSDIAFYPAAYDHVVSVASSGASNSKSGFSNYNSTVDITAPGSGIFNTIPNNDYASLNGTSMASPVVAGAFALALQSFPNYSKDQIIEQMLGTASSDLNTNNFVGKLGSGLLDIEEMINNKNAKNISLANYNVSDLDNNNIFESGEELRIDFSLKNILNNINNFSYNFYNNQTSEILESEIINKGLFETNQSFLESQVITLPEELPLDFNYNLSLNVTGDGYSREFILPFNVNQSYRNIGNQKIDLTINSRGNLGFNDYPSNNQGIGFSYLDGSNLLFEGGLIISTSSNSISSVVRSSNQGSQYSDFTPNSVVVTEDLWGAARATNSFKDNNIIGRAGVEITKEYLISKSDELSNVVFIKNIIKNTSNFDTDSLFVGYFFDWDLGQSGRNNVAEFWEEENIGIQYSNDDQTLPYVASALISDGEFIFYPLDNDGSSEMNPGVYDGFTKNEQWQLISGEISRSKSNITDASMVFSSGPYSLQKEETIEIIYVLMVADSKSDFPDLYSKAKINFEQLSIKNQNDNDAELLISPNPIKGNSLTIETPNEILGLTTINITSIKGTNVFSETLNIDKSVIELNLDLIESGSYFIELINNGNKYKGKFISL
ncbi:S8 family serine peptidase [Candidatus Kapabacteria bacterium]|nr:S8 family serine peptidase [Candidatus Kapabacteria bacterium]